MNQAIAEAKRALRRRHQLKVLPPEDLDWIRAASVADTYWSLYFFCKIVLRYCEIKPDIHLLYTEFLESKASNYKLAMMPRGFVKSWILYAKAIRDYLRDNNVRVLLAMSTEENARKASEFISNQFTRNQLIRYLWPENVPTDQSGDRWTMKARTLPRTIDAPEPTYTFAGVKTELVSGHYDKIFLDDVFAKEASESEEVANKVFSFIASCAPLRADPATSEIVQTCTRWAVDDPAGKIMGFEKQNTDELVFRALGDPQYICLKRAAIEHGKPIWPERYPEKELAALERGFESSGQGHFFAFQYLNNPVDARVVEFPLPRYWDRDKSGDILLRQPDGQDIVIQERHLYRTMTIDPAYKTKKSHDDAAICVLGTHQEGYIVNLFSWVGKLGPSDLAEKIVQTVKESFDKGFPLAAVGLETNAQQLAFKILVGKAADRAGVHIPWRDLKTGPETTKYTRIRHMVGHVASGAYYTSSRFVMPNREMKMFPASRKLNWLDAFAYQPQLWPQFHLEPVEIPEEDRLPWRAFTPSDMDPNHPLLRSANPSEVEGYGG